MVSCNSSQHTPMQYNVLAVGGLQRPKALLSSMASESSAGSFTWASRWRKREQRSQCTCFLTSSAGHGLHRFPSQTQARTSHTAPLQCRGPGPCPGWTHPAAQLCQDRDESLMDSCHPTAPEDDTLPVLPAPSPRMSRSA